MSRNPPIIRYNEIFLQCKSMFGLLLALNGFRRKQDTSKQVMQTDVAGQHGILKKLMTKMCKIRQSFGAFSLVRCCFEGREEFGILKLEDKPVILIL